MMFDPAFKEAISNLSSKEKDKLLFRLLKKDLKLVNRLYFELVSTKTVDDLRSEMEERIEIQVKKLSDDFYSFGYLNMDVRYLSGDITHHVSKTKDKFGDISLNLLLLREVMRHNVVRIENSKKSKAKNKFIAAIYARVFKVLKGIQKLDEDYFIDFEEDLKAVGNCIGNSDLMMREAIYHGLDVNWLLQPYIPEDIVEIHKNLRERGYLR